MMSYSERARLESISNVSLYAAGVNSDSVKYCFKVARRHLVGESILGHVLEHVENPVDILSRAKQWLEPSRGRVFGAVPNSRSLHRQAAVIMGLLRQEDQLNEMDIHHGHRRVFNPETFRNTFSQAGLKIELFGGYWMKPVSNSQIQASWTPEMVEAFMALGERYPDIAGEIYVVATRGA